MNLLRDVIKPLSAYILILVILIAASPVFVDHLYVMFLLLPLLDKWWSMPDFGLSNKLDVYIAVACFLSTAGLLVAHPGQAEYFFAMLALTALPEEWFFRGYLLPALKPGWRANIIVSLGFAILHIASQGVHVGALVFFPSLVFGWVYLRTKSLVSVVALHAVSNLVFSIYVKQWLIVGNGITFGESG